MRFPRKLLEHVDVRRQELERLLFMATYLCLIIASYTIAKAARDSLFVYHIGPTRLPYVYLLIAAITGVVSYRYSKAANRIGLYPLMFFTWVLAASSLLAFWWSIHANAGGPALFYILYVWVSIFGVITASQFWLLANHVFNAREARRLFSWLGAGGILGGILGGVLTRHVAPRFGTESLLVLTATLSTLAMGLLHSIRSLRSVQSGPAAGAASGAEGAQQEPGQNSVTLFQQVRQSRYLSMLTALMAIGVVVEAFVDYEFKFVAQQSFASKDQLTVFFGTLAAAIGVFSMLFQLVLTGPVLKRFGVGIAILFLPIGLLGASVMLTAWPALWAAATLQLVDGALSYSIQRSGMELLYLPIPSRTKNAVKGFIDMFVDRMGRALGGTMLLFLTAVLFVPISGLSLLVSGFIVVWIGIAVAMKREYLHSFRVGVEKKTIEPEALEVGILDRPTLTAVLRALSGTNERQVLYALDLLRNTHPNRWSRHALSLIQHQSSAVRARTISLLALWKYPAPMVSMRIEDSDLAVRTEAIRYLCQQAPQPLVRLKAFLHDPDYRIVHSAIECMTKYNLGGSDLLGEGFIETALTTQSEGNDLSRIAAARALNLLWDESPRCRELLDSLLRDTSLAVVRHAIDTAGNVRCRDAVPRLIEKLADSQVRKEAREALLKFGPVVIPDLAARLRDRGESFRVRAQIPKVLAHTNDQEAAGILLGSLHYLEYSMGHLVMKALNQMRINSSSLVFQRITVTDLLQGERDAYFELRNAFDWVRHYSPRETTHDSPGAAFSVLRRALGERLEQRRERIFRLLALIYPPNDVYSAYYSCTAKPALRATAVEFLDNLLDPAFRQLAIPPIEDSFEREQTAEPDGEPLPTEAVLRKLITGPDSWLQTIGIDLAGRLRIPELAELIRPALLSSDPILRETAEAALRSLMLPVAHAEVMPT